MKNTANISLLFHHLPTVFLADKSNLLITHWKIGINAPYIINSLTVTWWEASSRQISIGQCIWCLENFIALYTAWQCHCIIKVCTLSVIDPSNFVKTGYDIWNSDTATRDYIIRNTFSNARVNRVIMSSEIQLSNPRELIEIYEWKNKLRARLSSKFVCAFSRSQKSLSFTTLLSIVYDFHMFFVVIHCSVCYIHRHRS